jgi:hypothetical protein
MRPYDGDRTCTGVGSLCGGAHTFSATPSLVGTKGIEPFPAGPRPAMLPITPRLPFRRCQWGLHPPASPYQDAASLPRPWHHEAGEEIRTPMGPLTGRSLILVEPHRHVECHVKGARARNEAQGQDPRRIFLEKANDVESFGSGTVQQCDCVRVIVIAASFRHLHRSLSSIMVISSMIRLQRRGYKNNFRRCSNTLGRGSSNLRRTKRV